MKPAAPVKKEVEKGKKMHDQVAEQEAVKHLIEKHELESPATQDRLPHHPVHRRSKPIESTCPAFPSSEEYPGRPNSLTYEMPPPVKAPPTAFKSGPAKRRDPDPLTGHSETLERLLKDQQANRQEVMTYVYEQREATAVTNQQFQELMSLMRLQMAPTGSSGGAASGSNGPLRPSADH